MAIEETLDAMLKGLLENNRLLRQLLEASSTDLVKIPEAERKLGMSRATIMRRIRDKVYAGYRDGPTIRVSLSEIRQRMLEEAK